MLLAADPELTKLYNELVKAGVIGEEDFWASRQSMLQNERNHIQNQKIGMTSQLLADLRPNTEAECNTIRFKLTPAIIHHIFLENPAIYRAFLENVPDRLTDKEFWTQYISSKYYARDLGTLAGTLGELERSSSSVAVDRTRNIFANLKEDDNDLVNWEKVDMKSDLTASYEAGPSQKITSKYKLDDKEKHDSKSISLMKRFNRHSSLVLDSLEKPTQPKLGEKAKEKDDKDKKDSICEELGDNELLKVVPLNIKDQKRYFDNLNTSSAVPTSPKTATDEDLKKFQNISQCNINLSHVIIPEELVSDVVREVASNSTLPNIPAMEANKKTEILDANQQYVKDKFIFGNELLRHFWLSFPVSSPLLVAKISRIYKSIDLLYDELKAHLKSLVPPTKQQITPLINSLIVCLDKAIQKYDEFKQANPKMLQTETTNQK